MYGDTNEFVFTLEDPVFVSIKSREYYIILSYTASYENAHYSVFKLAYSVLFRISQLKILRILDYTELFCRIPSYLLFRIHICKFRINQYNI